LKTALFFLVVLVLSFNLSALAAKRQSSKASGGSSVTLTTPNPRTPLEHNNRGVELGSRGLWADAVKEHQEALNGDPENRTFRTNLSSAELSYARVLARSGKTYDAMVHYREALYADPNNSEADHELDTMIQKSTHKDPLTLSLRLNMAEDAETSGNFPVAIVEYRKCVKISDSGPMHARLGVALLKQRKTVDGYLELKTAVAKDWSNVEKRDLADTHRQLADILKEYGLLAEQQKGRADVAVKRLDNAAIEYRRALTIIPDSADSQRGLIEVSREAVGLNPNSFDNHLMLAGAYQLAGDFERAKDEYEKCWHLKKDDPRLAPARRSFHLAVVSHPAIASPLILASSIQKMENSLTENPNDPELLYIYARGKEAQQDPADALKSYQAAAQINPYIFPDLQERIRSLSGGAALPAANSAQGIKSAPNTASSPASSSAGAVASISGTDKSNLPANAKEEGSLAGVSETPAAMPPVDMGAAYSEIETKLNTNLLDEAEKKASEIVEKNPRDGHAWLLLGKVREKKNDLDSASVAYRMASSLKEPGAKDMLSATELARVKPQLDQADKLMEQNKTIEAEACLKDAVTLAPGLPIVHRKLAEVLNKLGDTKNASAEQKKADSLESNAK
jgi:tetratricopeptide (TPR) repeat protein